MKNTKQKDYQQMREGDFSNCTDIDLMRQTIIYLQKRCKAQEKNHRFYKSARRKAFHENLSLRRKVEGMSAPVERVVYDEAWIQKRADEIMLSIMKAKAAMRNNRNDAHIPSMPIELGNSEGMDEIRRIQHGDQIPYEKVVELAMDPNIKEPERTHYIKVLQQAKAMAENMGLPIERIRFNLFKSGLIKIHAPY